MSQDSIGVVTTGRGKLQEWKTTQKQNLSRKSRGTLTVKWAGSRDKIFSSSGRGRTFFLTFPQSRRQDSSSGSWTSLRRGPRLRRDQTYISGQPLLFPVFRFSVSPCSPFVSRDS